MSGECESEVKVTILIEAVIYTVRTVNLRGEKWNDLERREFDENLALLGEEFTFWSFLNNFVILWTRIMGFACFAVSAT